jgi:hypothetical protein
VISPVWMMTRYWVSSVLAAGWLPGRTGNG